MLVHIEGFPEADVIGRELSYQNPGVMPLMRPLMCIVVEGGTGRCPRKPKLVGEGGRCLLSDSCDTDNVSLCAPGGYVYPQLFVST